MVSKINRYLCAVLMALGWLASDHWAGGEARAAGMRGYINFPIEKMPAAIRNGQGLKLLEAGYLDITKAPYSADPTGKTDAAAALQQAIDDAYEMSLVVYVPQGTYLLGKPIHAKQQYQYTNPYTDVGGGSNRKHSPIVIGDTSGGTFPVLRAKDGAIGSAVFIKFSLVGTNSMPDARHYASLFRGFVIEMGDNPNATALSMSGAQLCSIEDVTIKGKFNIGIHNLPGSGGSTTNVRVTGGNIGISQTQYRPTPSIQGLELVGQKKYGVQIGGVRNGVIIAGFKIKDSGEAGVSVGGGKTITMADGSFELDAPAIVGGVVYLNNVYAKAATIVQGDGSLKGSAGQWTRVEHFGSGAAPIGVTTVSAPPKRLIGLHAWDPARVPTYFNTKVLDIRSFGATPDKDGDDDGPAINKALKDSAAQKRPVFVPRGRFLVRQTIEVPIGASMIGSSFTNSIIMADPGWLPASATSLMRTEDAVGDVMLMDFAVVAHEPAQKAGLGACKNMRVFHGRSSNMWLRDVQINRKQYWNSGGQDWSQTVALFTGNAGGRIYNLALDFHESAGTWDEHHMWRTEGTKHPLALYQPNSESSANNPQLLIKNSENVTWYALKFEKWSWYELLHIVGSKNIGILGGSGNYSTTKGKQMFLIKNSTDVVIANQRRSGNKEGGPLLVDEGKVIVPYTEYLIEPYIKGNPQLFGSLSPPDFPYPGSAQPSTPGDSNTDPPDGGTGTWELGVDSPDGTEGTREPDTYTDSPHYGRGRGTDGCNMARQGATTAEPWLILLVLLWFGSRRFCR